MAVVTQTLSPIRTYSPFEGLSEAKRLWSAVPRGLIRFDQETSLTAKPVNDSYDLQITCSLPGGFAYLMSGLSFRIIVDTATDFDAVASFRLFNGLPNVIPGNTQFATFAMANVPNTVALDPTRVLNYDLGDLKTWFPGPFARTEEAAGLSVLLNYHNSAAAVQAAGSLFFHFQVYQYELNQLVRFPLNFPLPVGPR